MEASTRDLARITHYSQPQVWRALRRLEGSGLIKRAGKGKQGKTRWQVIWRSFPQESDSPPSDSPSETEEKILLCKTDAPPSGAAWSEFPIRNRSKALRWAMFRIRRETERWGLSPPRRETLLRAVGAAIWRALRKGAVCTIAALRRLVTEILARLRDAPAGVSATLRRACAYAGWLIQSAIRDLFSREDPAAELRRRLDELRLKWRLPFLSPDERARIEVKGRQLRELLAQMAG